MVKVYSCRMCTQTFTSLLETCGHLLGEHGEYTAMLMEHLSNQKIPDSKTNETLLDLASRKHKSLQAHAAVADSGLAGFSGGLVDFEGEATRYVVEKYGTLYGFDRMEGALSSQNMIEQMFKDVDKVYEEDRTKEPVRIAALNEKDPEESNQANKEVVVTHEQSTRQASDKPSNAPPQEKQSKLVEEETKQEQIILEAGKELLPILQQFVTISTECPKCQLKVNMMRFTALHSCVRTMKNALCELCGHITSFCSLRQHYQQSHSELVQETAKCKYCDKQIAKKGMTNHIQRIHTDAAKATCVICNITLTSRHHLRRHEAIHRRVTPYKCLHCHRSFNQQTNLKTHMRQHTGEQPYKCDQCEKTFTHKVSLKTHLKKYHGIDLWKEGQTGGGRPKRRKTAT